MSQFVGQYKLSGSVIDQLSVMFINQIVSFIITVILHPPLVSKSIRVIYIDHMSHLIVLFSFL